MILDKIAIMKKIRVEDRKREKPLSTLLKEIEKMSEAPSFKDVFSREFSIIGEFKKASPSKGVIIEDFNIEKIKSVYDTVGINAFSVLTEEDFFLGRDEYLSYLSSFKDKPTLRKDFVIDPYQIYEAKALGASSVLLIYSLLKEKTGEFYKIAREIGLTPLVEVHNKEELLGALEMEDAIIGINNRNLYTFHTSLEVTKNLMEYVPKGRVVISESGIKSVCDLVKLKEMGARGALIGETFMKNLDNERFLEEVKEFLENAN